MDLALLESLNDRFAFENRLEFAFHESGLIAGHVKTDQCLAEFFLHGAHVTQFVPQDEKPLLFMSSESMFDSSNPIRGGIPICFPWFGSHPSNFEMPSHGFARISGWELVETSWHGESVQVELALKLAPFDLRYVMTFSSELHVELQITNASDELQTCETALHTYFAVSNIANVSLTGLENDSFIDQLTREKHPPSLDSNGLNGSNGPVHPISFEKETDLIYLETSAAIQIHDSDWNRTIEIEKEGSLSTVVWNPWIAKSARMPDFGNDEYQNMVCVETANISPQHMLIQPNELKRVACRHSILQK